MRRKREGSAGLLTQSKNFKRLFRTVGNKVDDVVDSEVDDDEDEEVDA